MRIPAWCRRRAIELGPQVTELIGLLFEINAPHGLRYAKGHRLRRPMRRRAARRRLPTSDPIRRSELSHSERPSRRVGQHRSTQRLDPPVIDDDEQQLREFLRDFARRRPRWGWRRAAQDSRRGGWQVNDKRIRRLWRDEG